MEHSSYYEGLASRLASLGVASFALDHVGHGRSEGESLFVEHMDHRRDDVLFLTALARKKVGENLPVFLYGHSMGG